MAWEAAKEAGNAAFQRGEWAAALAAYTSALEQAEAPSQHLLLSNRAATYLARGAPGDALAALADSNAALRLAPTFGKAHGRKGAALLALGQTAEALQAYQSGVRHDPGNAALRAGLEATQERLAKVQEKRLIEEREAAKRRAREAEEDLRDEGE